MAVTSVQPFLTALLSGFVVIQPHRSPFKHEPLLSQQFTVHLYHRPVSWSSCASALDHKTISNSPLIFSAWENILRFHQSFNGLERAGHTRTRTLNTKRGFFDDGKYDRCLCPTLDWTFRTFFSVQCRIMIFMLTMETWISWDHYCELLWCSKDILEG